MFSRPAADPAPLARLLVGNNYDRWRSRVRGLPAFFGALPASTMAEEMETPGDRQLRALVTVAGNPVMSVPSGERLGRALGKLDYMVSVDIYLNETTRHANLVLPPLHAFDTGSYDLVLLALTVRNFARYSPPLFARGEGLDDFDILAGLAMRIGLPDIPLLRGIVGRVVAGGADRVVDLLLRRSGLSLEKLRAAPHGIDLGPLVPARADKVRRPRARVQLAPPLLVADCSRIAAWLATPPPELVLIGRRDLRSNNSWMHNAPSLAKGPDRSRLMMNPKDAARLALDDGVAVRVTSRSGELTTRLKIDDEVMAGVVSLPHGFGHGAAAETLKVAGKMAGANVNAITDDAFVEPLLGTAILNGIPVTVSAV